MAKYISTHLANLIKARGYTHGAVLRIQEEATQVNQELNRLQAEVDRLTDEIHRLEAIETLKRTDLGRLDKKLRKLAPNIDPTQIQPRVGKQAAIRWRRGEFNACLCRAIKQAPVGATTTEILVKVAAELRLPLTPQQNYLRHRDGVRRQLSRWVELGFVERLHDPLGPNEGCWRWVSRD